MCMGNSFISFFTPNINADKMIVYFSLEDIYEIRRLVFFFKKI
jgi:hypothetical protein